MKLIGISNISSDVFTLLADVISEHALVCNNAELAFLINETLEENDLPPIDEGQLVRFLSGRVNSETVISPEYQMLSKIIKRAVIEQKRTLMKDYNDTQDWLVKSKVEFLMKNRFPTFGQEPSESAVAVEGTNIVINIDNRKIEMSAPITSETQMLDEADILITQYLDKHGIATDRIEI